MLKQLQVRRGLKAVLPTEAVQGELLFATDVDELWIGQGLGVPVIQIGMNVLNIAKLDGSGKLDPNVLPALAISETFVEANEVDMLANTVQAGDITVRTDLNKSFIALNDTNGAMTDWQELLSPTDSVASVNGQTGVVTLDSDDIDEGTTNLYFTAARAQAAAALLTLQELADVSTTAPTDNQILQYNSTNGQYEPVDASSVGTTLFTGLNDTPADYTGHVTHDGSTVRVKPDGTGLYFVDDFILDGGTF